MTEEDQPILKEIESDVEPLSEKEADYVLGEIAELTNLYFSVNQLASDVAEDLPRSANFYLNEILQLFRFFNAI